MSAARLYYLWAAVLTIDVYRVTLQWASFSRWSLLTRLNFSFSVAGKRHRCWTLKMRFCRVKKSHRAAPRHRGSGRIDCYDVIAARFTRSISSSNRCSDFRHPFQCVWWVQFINMSYFHCFTALIPFGGHDSSVGIATRYGLDGPGIESRSGRDFPHPSRPALGPTQPPIQWVPGLSRG